MDIKGKVVVLTGKFSSFGREEATQKLRALGAVVSESLSKKTDVLFAGDKAGSKKDKADKLGVMVLGEAELLEVLRSGANPAPTDVDAKLAPTGTHGATPAQRAAAPLAAGRDASSFVRALEAQIREKGHLLNEPRAIALGLDGAPDIIRSLADALATHGYHIDLGEFDLWPARSVDSLADAIAQSLDALDEDPDAALAGLDPTKTLRLGADGGGMSEFGVAWADDTITIIVVELEDPTPDNLVARYHSTSAFFAFLRDRLDAREAPEVDADLPFDPDGLADLADRIQPGSGNRFVAPPSAADLRFATYFADPAVTASLRKKALAAAKKGQVGLAPIVGFSSASGPSDSAREEPLRWPGAERDVLFVPHEDGRERVLITEHGASTGQELSLPSTRSYRDLAALSPDGRKLLVGSPVCMRVVDLVSGDARVVLQGPQQVGVVWLDREFVGVLTRAGDHALDPQDPDVAELPAVKKLGNVTTLPAMRTPGLLHVLSEHSGKLVASLQINAESIERVPALSALCVRREPPDEKSWGTLFLRTDGSRLTSIAKLPCDIGALTTDGSMLRGSHGFEILGLEAAARSTTVADHRKFIDGMKLEPTPPPPSQSKRLGHTIELSLTDEWGTTTPEALAANHDWIQSSTVSGLALATRRVGDEHEISLVNVGDGSTVTVVPPLRMKSLEYAWAWDGSRVLLWEGQVVHELLPSGAWRTLPMLPGPVLSVAAVRDGETAILHRGKDLDAQLDVYDATGALHWFVDVFSHDAMWSMNQGTLLVIGAAHAHAENAGIHLWTLGTDGPRLLQAQPMSLPVRDVLSAGDTTFVELVDGARYKLENATVPSLDPASAIVRKLDTRTGVGWRYGYIDKAGEWVVAPVWEMLDKWQGGCGRAGSFQRLGLIGADGRHRTSASFKLIHPFVEGVAPAATANGPMGALAPDGSWVLEPVFDFVGDVSGGCVRTGRGGVYALRTLSGDVLADGFKRLYAFSDGLAYAEREGQAGFLKPDGTWAFEGPFTETTGFVDGVAGVKFETDWGLVRADGTRVPGTYEQLGRGRLGTGSFIAVARRGSDWGYVNGAGELMADYQFKAAYGFRGELAPVVLHSGAGAYVTSAGKVLQGTNWKTYSITSALAWFSVNGKFGALTADGTIVHEPTFDAVENFSEGLVPVKNAGKWALMDESGRIVMPPVHDLLRSPSDGRIAFQAGTKWGYLDMEGKVVVEPKFAEALSFYEGYAMARPG